MGFNDKLGTLADWLNDLKLCLGGSTYFYVIEQLPRQEGDLSMFRVLQIEGRKTLTGAIIESELLLQLEEKPKRSLEARGRQLRDKMADADGVQSVVIIDHAELLTTSTLEDLKVIYEFSHPILILVGDLGVLKESFAKAGLSQRADFMDS